eukprot:11807504-Ditylum_brightwellii.AAC.1
MTAMSRYTLLNSYVLLQQSRDLLRSSSEEESKKVGIIGVKVEMLSANKSDNAASSGKYLSKLLAMLLDELKACPTAKEAYTTATKIPNDLIASQFCKLNIDRHKIDVRKHPGDEEVKIFKDALVQFDPEYKNTYRGKGQLNMMPLTNKFLSSEDHVRVGPFLLETRLC